MFCLWNLPSLLHTPPFLGSAASTLRQKVNSYDDIFCCVGERCEREENRFLTPVWITNWQRQNYQSSFQGQFHSHYQFLSLLLLGLFIFFCVYDFFACMCVYAPCVYGARRGQKRTLDPKNWSSRKTVGQHVGTGNQTQSSGRAASAPNH